MVARGRYIPGKRLELPEPNCLPAPSVTSGRSAMNTTRQPTSMPPLSLSCSAKKPDRGMEIETRHRF